MRKLFEKNEILFAVLCIVIYSTVAGTLKGRFGEESIWTLAVLLMFLVQKSDNCLVAEFNGKVVGAVWTRIN